MSKWLVKYYPISPAQELKIYNLDVLDCDDYCSKQYQDSVRSELEEYNIGLKRTGLHDGFTHYNNKNMIIIEAGEIKDVLKEFLTKFK